DTEASAYPGGSETYYDGIDGDCDGYSDYDYDMDGFDSDAYGGDDCDDSDDDQHPYRWENMSNGIDDDCDGDTDTADGSAVTTTMTGDDTYQTITWRSGVTFPFCGTNYSTAYLTTNGRVTFGSGDASYTEYASYFAYDLAVAGVWDDLYAYTNDISWVRYDDALGVYFNGIPQYGVYSDSSTFAIVLMDDGRIYLEYDALSMSDGLAGFSCNRAVTEAEVDLSSEAANLAYGAKGIGTGTEDMVYEIFTGSGGDVNDLDEAKFFLCGNAGSDGDGDGWTEECGDSDDSDPSVFPY
ncbi:MAG: hypothetical protein FJ102_02425, partial [Deltaproteobacteria bacterium]|nr:hypothetical protein [Deltaproteobacteria bacterium]